MISETLFHEKKNSAQQSTVANQIPASNQHKILLCKHTCMDDCIDSATSVANSFKRKENLDKKYFLGNDDLLYENQITEDELTLGQKSKNDEHNLLHRTTYCQARKS
jgi:hypothetical protein